MTTRIRARIAVIAALVLPGLVGVVGTVPPALAEGPAFLSPSPGETLSRVAEVRVQSSAPVVDLELDGAWSYPGTVAVRDGIATYVWQTYGSANGEHTLSATDCRYVGEALSCDGGSVSVAVRTVNEAPTLVWPSGPILASGVVTFRASAPEGALAFRLMPAPEGALRSQTDACSSDRQAAPYTWTIDTADCREGVWLLQVVRCGTSRCNGPSAPAVSVTVRNLHPRVVAQTVQAIDPLRAERRDTVRWTYRLERAQYVRWRIEGVRDWTYLGRQAAGLHTIAWAGHDDDGKVVPDGLYRPEIRTRAGALRGRARAWVRVITVPTPIRVRSTTPTAFYPVRDGYLDRFRPHVPRYGPRYTLIVTDDAGRRVRSITVPVGARGAARIPSWDGRNAAGDRVPAGQYRWRLRRVDDAGHVVRTSWRTVRLSYRRAELVTLRHTVAASSYTSSFGAGCSTPGASSFGASGVLLANPCPSGGSDVGVRYRIEVPRALAYSRVGLEVYARAPTTELRVDLVRPDGPVVTLTWVDVDGPQWYPALTRDLTWPDGTVAVGLAVPPQGGPDEWVDVRSIRVTLRAYVWAD